MHKNIVLLYCIQVRHIVMLASIHDCEITVILQGAIAGCLLVWHTRWYMSITLCCNKPSSAQHADLSTAHSMSCHVHCVMLTTCSEPLHLSCPRVITCSALCMQITITQNPEAEASNEVLPVSYPKFTTMIQKGDTIFIGRYLVTGSEDSSLYVTVCSCSIQYSRWI